MVAVGGLVRRHWIIECFGLEGSSKDHLDQNPGNKQEHPELDWGPQSQNSGSHQAQVGVQG